MIPNILLGVSLTPLYLLSFLFLRFSLEDAEDKGWVYHLFFGVYLFAAATALAYFFSR